MDRFRELYESKLTTPEALAQSFRPGDRIQFGVWYGEAYGVLDAIYRHCAAVAPLYIGVSIATSHSSYLNLGGVYCLTGFLGPNERASMAARGNVYYTPLHYTDARRSVSMGTPIQYFVQRVGPMDDRGMFNFSLTCSWEYNAIRFLKEHRPETKIVFEVNHNLPRVFGRPEAGDNELSIDYPDIIVEDDTPLLEYPTPVPGEVEKAIAANVASLIEDRATVQLGFGNVPMAIGHLLEERRELGIHTEMFCDAHIDLIEAGAVTNAHKGLYDGQSVATFALGSRRLHHWLRENRDFAMLPVELVNHVAQLAKVRRMTSVNSVLTVDMTGQACAHCLGPRTYSGLGGAFEFAYGAQLSPGGQSIACLPSTSKLKSGETVSNIVAQYPVGTRITIPEHTIDWVVTEHGAARLKCLPLEQRAQALIDIAHPDFREDLARQMREGGMRLEKAEELPAPPAYFFSRR